MEDLASISNAFYCFLQLFPDMETKTEKAITVNSLVCLLKALEGQRTTVELRNENSVRGWIVHVDCHMNTRMENCVFTKLDGTRERFDNFFVLGKQIRFVHIPDKVDIISAIYGQLRKYNHKSEFGQQKKVVDHKKRKLLKKLARKSDKSSNDDSVVEATVSASFDSLTLQQPAENAST